MGAGLLDSPLFVTLAAMVAGAIAALPHVVATTVRWWRLRADVDGHPTFRQFGIASAVGGLAGAGLQPLVGSTVLTIVLALLLMLAGGSELMRRRLPLPPTAFWRLAGRIPESTYRLLIGAGARARWQDAGRGTNVAPSRRPGNDA